MKQGIITKTCAVAAALVMGVSLAGLRRRQQR